MSQRNATTHELQWDPNQYPSGIPAFAARLATEGISLGLYGAASGVTCGGVSGQLGYEDLDMQTVASWGVRYWKSDNCASYAMDSSVRFAGASARRARLQGGAASLPYLPCSYARCDQPHRCAHRPLHRALLDQPRRAAVVQSRESVACRAGEEEEPRVPTHTHAAHARMSPSADAGHLGQLGDAH